MFANKHKVKPVFDLLYAGRFDKQKNLFFLLKVIKQVKDRIPNLKVCFIGDGSQKNEMQKFIQDNHLGENVIIKKGVYNLSSYFRKVKIFTMCSIYEGMPVVLLEAMAAKLSVVTKKCPGSDEYLVNGKTAFIEDNIDDYSNRVETLLKQPNLRRKIGNNASRYVKTHFSENEILKYIEVLLPGIQVGL
jgi:glycosyltransferase involved in cell wall biosynthesis